MFNLGILIIYSAYFLNYSKLCLIYSAMSQMMPLEFSFCINRLMSVYRNGKQTFSNISKACQYQSSFV